MAKAVSSPANRGWTDREFDRLFKAFPPSGSRPSASDFQRLGAELDRTADGVSWMWQDAASLLRGKLGASSKPLRDYVASQGWQAAPDRSPEPARIRPNRPAPTPATSGTKAATPGLARRITEAFNAHTLDLGDRPGAGRQGWDRMPEVAFARRIREAGGTDLHVRLWLTFTVALDRMRDADLLADVAWRLWSAKRWVYDPEAVAARPFAEIKATLMEEHVSKFHGPDSWAWFRIARTLSDPAISPAVHRAVFGGTGDACELLDAVKRYGQDRMPLFPSLRGPKISRLWIRELALPGAAEITSLAALDVAVDVQVRKVTENLDMAATRGMKMDEARPIIQAAWAADVREHGAAGPAPLEGTPAALDPALWFFGKWGCTICEQRRCRCPISQLCGGCNWQLD